MLLIKPADTVPNLIKDSVLNCQAILVALTCFAREEEHIYVLDDTSCKLKELGKLYLVKWQASGDSYELCVVPRLAHQINSLV